jgi:hypothetical protein
MLNAFCLVAPSVRFSLSAIRDARFFRRAIVLSIRTCSEVHARRFRAFFAIEQLPVSKKKLFSWKQFRTKAEIRCRLKPCGKDIHFGRLLGDGPARTIAQARTARCVSLSHALYPDTFSRRNPPGLARNCRGRPTDRCQQKPYRRCAKAETARETQVFRKICD